MSQADSLKSQGEALDNDEAGAVCELAHLDKRGSASAKQKRILSFIDGPPSRQRPGWLQFLTACFLCSKPPPRAVATALHRGEGAAHVSDGRRRAMLTNVGALPPAASSSVGRAAGFTPRCWLRRRALGNHGQEIWKYELAGSRNARRCMKSFIFCLLQEITYDQDFRLCAQHA